MSSWRAMISSCWLKTRSSTDVSTPAPAGSGFEPESAIVVGLPEALGV
jgi:hypothetical protein